MPVSATLPVADLKAEARALGFDLCGIAPPEAFPELARLDEWLARGYAGEMAYLHKSADTRRDIRRFLPSVRSVIVTGTVYYTDSVGTANGTAEDASHGAAGVSRSGGSPAVARYAWGDDYHVVLAERLERLVAWLRQRTGEPFDARVFVDKHHVQERVFARYAGLGWIGKNTCLINPELGSWLFLSGVAVSLPLEVDTPIGDLCGACTLCLDACPTGALVDAYELDATRCISYLTIEHRGPIPEERRAQLGEHVYGCDVCQEVCPYNLAPVATEDPAWRPKAGRAVAQPAELWQKSDFDLHALVKGSAMTRASLSRLRRNVAVVLGNTSGGESAVRLLDAPGGGVRRAAQSAETPLVQEHVAWARRRAAERVDPPRPSEREAVAPQSSEHEPAGRRESPAAPRSSSGNCA